MGAKLKALLGLMSLLDRHIELVSLQKGEREILRRILGATDGSGGVLMSELLATSGVSRASTYRHVASLIDRNLVRESFAGGERVLSASEHSADLDRMVREFARATA